MDVTRANFEEALACLEGALRSASLAFVSIDEEMTGINFAQQDLGEVSSWEDTTRDRYEKMRLIASNFGIVQLGVTAWLREARVMRAVSLNIYVFPSGADGEDVLLSPAAVEFLDGHGMDWATWLSKGVPFLAQDTSSEAQQQQLLPPPMQLRRRDEADFAQRETKRVRAWMSSSSSSSSSEQLTNPQQRNRSLVTEPCPSAAAAKFMHDFVAREFPSVAKTERREGYRIGVVLLSPEERARLDDDRRKEKLRRLGAKRAFTAISEACRRVPLVGHNCYFDLLFLLSHFHGPLPEDALDFKRTVHRLFPRIYDTKVLASTCLRPAVSNNNNNHHQAMPGQQQQQKTTLEALYEVALRIRGGTPVVFDVSCPKYANAQFPLAVVEEGQVDDGDANKRKSYHEAGWDSFVTGLVFFRSFFDDNDAGALVNRLYLMRSHAHLDLAAEATIEPPAVQPNGTLYVVRGPGLQRDAVYHLFPTVHRVSYCGQDAFLVDSDTLPATLPPAVELRTWADDARRRQTECLVVPQTKEQPTGTKRRLFSWLFSPSSWNPWASAPASSSSSPEEHQQQQHANNKPPTTGLSPPRKKSRNDHRTEDNTNHGALSDDTA